MVPRQPEATERRPETSVCIAMRKPSPSLPSMLSPLTGWSFIWNIAVSEVYMPGLACSASFSNVSPAVSTMIALMRRSLPVAPSGNAKTITASAMEPLEMRYLTPFMISLPPSRR